MLALQHVTQMLGDLAADTSRSPRCLLPMTSAIRTQSWVAQLLPSDLRSVPTPAMPANFPTLAVCKPGSSAASNTCRGCQLNMQTMHMQDEWGPLQIPWGLSSHYNPFRTPDPARLLTAGGSPLHLRNLSVHSAVERDQPSQHQDPDRQLPANI